MYRKLFLSLNAKSLTKEKHANSMNIIKYTKIILTAFAGKALIMTGAIPLNRDNGPSFFICKRSRNETSKISKANQVGPI